MDIEDNKSFDGLSEEGNDQTVHPEEDSDVSSELSNYKNDTILTKGISEPSCTDIIQCRREIKYHAKMVKKLKTLKKRFKEARLKPFTTNI